MSARTQAALRDAITTLRGFLRVDRPGYTTCARCATAVPPGAPACPLCSLPTRVVATRLDRLRERGLLEIAVVVVVAVSFAAAWTVLWVTR